MTRRLAQVLVKEPEPMRFHAEIVRRNGRPIGYVRAGSYGHTLGGAVGLAMIEAGQPMDATYLKDRCGRWRSRASFIPLRCPSNHSTIPR